MKEADKIRTALDARKKSTSGYRKIFIERRLFHSIGSWSANIYDRILRKYKRVWLPLRKRVTRIYLKELNIPFFVRLGTSDFAVLREIFLSREYELLEVRGIAPQDYVIDMGANVGISIRLWKYLQPKCRVIAVEPDQENAAIAHLNIEALGSGHDVQLFEGCVLGASRRVMLDRSSEEWAFRVSNLAEPREGAVEGLSVKDLLIKYNVEGTIALIKCDIEGAEREVFANCADWIHKTRCLMIEIHPPYTTKALMADISRSGGDFSILAQEQKGGGLELLMLINNVALRDIGMPAANEHPNAAG